MKFSIIYMCIFYNIHQDMSWKCCESCMGGRLAVNKDIYNIQVDKDQVIECLRT